MCTSLHTSVTVHNDCDDCFFSTPSVDDCDDCLFQYTKCLMIVLIVFFDTTQVFDDCHDCTSQVSEVHSDCDDCLL